MFSERAEQLTWLTKKDELLVLESQQQVPLETTRTQLTTTLSL